MLRKKESRLLFGLCAMLLLTLLLLALPMGAALADDVFADPARPNVEAQSLRALEELKALTGADGEVVESNHEAFCIRLAITNDRAWVDLAQLTSLQKARWYDYEYLPSEELPFIEKTQELFFWFFNDDAITAAVCPDRFQMARAIAFTLTGSGDEGVLVASDADTFRVRVSIGENGFVGALHIPEALRGTLDQVTWDEYAYKPGDLLPLIGKRQELVFTFSQLADVETVVCADMGPQLPSERLLESADEKKLLEYAAADALFPSTGFADLQLWEQEDGMYCVQVTLLEDIRIGKIDLSMIPLLNRVTIDGKAKVYDATEKLPLTGSNQRLYCWFSVGSDEPDGPVESVTIEGVVVNAVTGDPLPDVRISIRAGADQQTGAALNPFVIITNDAGEYSYSGPLPAGDYTIEFSCGAYVSTFINFEIAAQAVEIVSPGLTPVGHIARGELQVVLSWNTDEDLDLHAVGHPADGRGFHVFFSTMEYVHNGERVAWLDRDVIPRNGGTGPETLTASWQNDEVYTFSVHNFSGFYPITSSGAHVTVSQEGRQIASYNMPAEGDGNLWTIFCYDGTTITPVNTITTVPAANYAGQ